MSAVISRQIDSIGISAIIPDIAKVHIVPYEKVVIFKFGAFLNIYTVISETITGWGICSGISDICKADVVNITPYGIIRIELTINS